MRRRAAFVCITGPAAQKGALCRPDESLPVFRRLPPAARLGSPPEAKAFYRLPPAFKINKKASALRRTPFSHPFAKQVPGSAGESKKLSSQVLSEAGRTAWQAACSAKAGFIHEAPAYERWGVGQVMQRRLFQRLAGPVFHHSAAAGMHGALRPRAPAPFTAFPPARIPASAKSAPGRHGPAASA